MIDADKVIKDMQYYHDDSAQTSVYTRLGFETAIEVVKSASPVEAIPKADYENRLKADMVAMLEELRLEADEINGHRYDSNFWEGVCTYDDLVKEKINALKGDQAAG